MFIENINYLYSLIVIIPTILLLYLYSNKKRNNVLKDFSPSIISINKYYYSIKIFLIILVFIFSIFSLSKPKYGYKLEKFFSSKSEILIALDISDSMLAEDIKPNRLIRGKRKILDLLDNLQGEKVGLVIFSGISFLQCPFTSDYSAIKMFLDYIDTSLIPIKGTSYSNLLDKSLKIFKDNSDEKYMIIISDGEDNQNDFNSYLSKIKEKNIKIFTLGIGEETGVPIDLPDSSLKKDKNGNIVITKLESKNLKLISNDTGAFYLKSNYTDDDIKTIYFNGIKGKNEAEASNNKKIWNEIFQYFLIFAFLFLIIEFIFSNKDEKFKINT